MSFSDKFWADVDSAIATKLASVIENSKLAAPILQRLENALASMKSKGGATTMPLGGPKLQGFLGQQIHGIPATSAITSGASTVGPESRAAYQKLKAESEAWTRQHLAGKDLDIHDKLMREGKVNRVNTFDSTTEVPSPYLTGAPAKRIYTAKRSPQGIPASPPVPPQAA